MYGGLMKQTTFYFRGVGQTQLTTISTGDEAYSDSPFFELMRLVKLIIYNQCAPMDDLPLLLCQAYKLHLLSGRSKPYRVFQAYWIDLSW